MPSAAMLAQLSREPQISPSIRVSGGVVETRDPVHFAEGELLTGQDAYYKPNNPALWAVQGREAFNNVPAGAPILGARYLEYDGAADVLVIHLGNKLREAAAALTGVFATATGIAATLVSAGVPEPSAP